MRKVKLLFFDFYEFNLRLLAKKQEIQNFSPVAEQYTGIHHSQF